MVQIRGCAQHFQPLEDCGDFHNNGNEIAVLPDWKMAWDWEVKGLKEEKADLRQPSESSLKQNKCIVYLLFARKPYSVSASNSSNLRQQASFLEDNNNKLYDAGLYVSDVT